MKRSIWLPVLVFVIFSLIAGYFFANYKKPRNPANEQANVVSPGRLYQSMFENQSDEFLNKTVQVTGELSEVDIASNSGSCAILIPGQDAASIRVSFTEKHLKELNTLSAGSTVSVKGICTGVLADTIMDGLVSVDIRLRDGLIVN